MLVDLTLAFREGTTAELVKAQFSQLEAHAANYSLTISGVSGESSPPAASQHHPAWDPLSPASGSLLFLLELVRGEPPPLGDCSDHCFPFSARCPVSFLCPVCVWGAWLGHCPAGAGLRSGCAGHHLSHCPGECPVPSPDRVPLLEGAAHPHNLLSPQVVCQCGRKKCEQLDIFPTLDAYHPMSEYSAYHTHGRFVPPGSTKRSPYEEVREVGAAVGRKGFVWAVVLKVYWEDPKNVEEVT